MSSASPRPPAGYRLETHTLPHGRVRLELRPDDHWLDAVVPCRLTIDRLELSSGADGDEGVLVVDGIGNVLTHPDHRRRGLAASLMAIADAEMRRRGAQAGLLYGIDGFYGRMGWQPCGGERWVQVDLEQLPGTRPSGWSVRRMHGDDLPAIEALYADVAACTPGAALRPHAGRTWSRLDPDDAMVVVGAGEQVAGWAWFGRGAVPERDAVARRRPDVFVAAELQATGEEPALALLHGVRDALASERAEDMRPLLTGAPDGHVLRSLARSGLLAATVADEYRPDGGAMLKPIAPGVQVRTNLYQFLPDRF